MHFTLNEFGFRTTRKKMKKSTTRKIILILDLTVINLYNFLLYPFFFAKQMYSTPNIEYRKTGSVVKSLYQKI